MDQDKNYVMQAPSNPHDPPFMSITYDGTIYQLLLMVQYDLINYYCWAAAKPGRSERGKKKAATLAARPAAKNLDRRVGRPNR
ncbi:hypothetical protein BpHYR1_031817 [Brachionus plicatilis]|uniref:Uncharacterized protein n=1 Tax=Brachionus plicatilis TaxID=10195 RepID=A0A3M7Q1P4_BRAPC|nr:hypothetical protein BpHYR1_031817 [Brachionus plicatilis]